MRVLLKAGMTEEPSTRDTRKILVHMSGGKAKEHTQAKWEAGVRRERRNDKRTRRLELTESIRYPA
jgi:hypothetical protein